MMKKAIILLKAAAFSLMLLCIVLKGNTQSWDTLPNIPVGRNFYDFVTYHDTLVMVGNLSSGFSSMSTGIAAYGWDGETISFYIGETYGAVYSVGLYNGRLYIGGSFDDITNPDDISKLAVWNGTEWERVGTAVMGAGRINYFQVYRDTLYIGGDYGINVNGNMWGPLVKWNDTAFYSTSPYSTPSMGIEVYNDALYAGLFSCFSVGGSQYVCSLGKYDGQAWTNVYDKNGNQFQAGVSSLLTDTINNDLYIAGISVFRFDGESFHLIGTAGSQVNGHAMQMYHGDLYIGGMFSQVDGIPAKHLAKWDGEQWSEPGGGTNYAIEALYVYKDELYAGGFFTQVGGYLPAYGVARYYEPEVEDCRWFRPRIQTVGYQDTFYITQSQPYIFVNFVNNNAYAESWEWDFGDGFSGSGSKDIEHGYYQPGEYTVLVEVTQDGCTKTAEKLIVIEDHTGGIASKTGNDEITLFPNPCYDKIWVPYFCPVGETYRVEICDITGRVLISDQLKAGNNVYPVFTSMLSPGTYLIRIANKNGNVKTKRFVKQQ
ncbi:MAG TPA: T9SS type A sorting domain-containing protein [Bacteroidales bacterium]|nr:T9SS type A sorting domain-containing protein [Bacteroidales bacterium]